MNLPVLHSVSFCLLALLLSPTAVTNASPPPADTVHFSCQFIGPKRSEHDQPLPATKGLADLNVGEPRTVRLIYSLPDGQPHRTETVEAMKTGILQIQSFFAEQMAAHGYGNRTFQIEADDQGEPTVHRVDGGSIAQMFDLSANIYLIVNDQAAPVQGSGSPSGKSGGSATIFSGWNWFAATHELGHAFGLHHDFRDNTYIMSYGRRDRESAQLSACTAEYLAANPHFNTDIPIEESPPPTIELISSPNYPLGSNSVPVRLRVRDGEGLYQVLLLSTTPHVLHPAYGGRELITCRGLTGQTDTVVELDYDGSIPSSVPTSLSDPSTHPIYVVAVDMAGNRSEASLVLTATSPQNVGTIEEEGSVREVVFSPNGTILASVLAGSATRNVKLWEMATRTNVGTIGGSGWGARSVAFSPNGTILASAEGPTIKLWDVQTKENIDTFQEPATPSSVAFSPDGTILASGLAGSSYVVRRESPIQLWDMTTRTNIATLERHGRGSVHSVAFSPNGQTLASGDTYTLELWDVATRTNFATIEDAGYSASISFSPDGSIIAMPGDWSDRTVIKLWDVATREQIATLEAQWTDSGWIGHLHDVYSVAFSPDGKILASAGGDRTIQLWDVATREHIVALHGHVSEVTSVAFAPAGTMLASASNDNTIKLWDTAEWTGTPAVSAPAGICDRTEEVRNAIVGAVSGVSDCALVTDAHLAGIADLKLRGLGITTLKVADFDGLTELTKLDLARNQLSSLPAGIFDNLTALEAIHLQHNHLSSLPADIFDHLNALTWLDLTHNQLRSLPAGIFDHLDALKTLYLFSNHLSSLTVDIFDHLNALTRLDLNDNQVRSLPVDIFDHLNALTFLRLDENQLSSLPSGIFDNLTALTHLYLYDNQLSSLSADTFDHLNALTFLHLSSNRLRSLPTGVFDQLSALTWLYLNGNAVDPLPLAVSLEKVGGDQVKAVAPSGAPFDVVLPITVTNGNIVGGAATLTIPIGRVESEVVTVTRTPDTLAAVTVDIGTLPGLPANHSGYQLVKSVDLPLVLTEFLTPICDRTPQVRDAIVAAVSGVSNCRSVAGAHLSTISELRLGSLSITALRVGDFGGLIELTELDLGRNQLSSLPQGIFDNLNVLTSLGLSSNQLSSLPEGLLDDLTTLNSLNLWGNQLSSLPEGHFDNLKTLTRLSLDANQLSSLPEGVFDNLNALRELGLSYNQLSSLPEGIFDNLNALISLGLENNQLSSLPRGLLVGLTALETLSLSGNQLSSLPAGIFVGLSSLTKLYLYGNAVDPLPLAVSLEKVGTDQLKAVAPVGAPLEIVLPLTVANGSISGGATSITIPAGSVESAPFTVTRTAGTTAAVTVDVGVLPGLPSFHEGYALVKSANLPVEILSSGEPRTTGARTDFNGDGRTDFVDFFLFVDAFGSTDARFDLNGDGRVDFVDFFEFVDAFGSSGQAKLVALAQEMLGLPVGPELQQNTPNPFNSETVISWVLLEPGPARLEVFALTGQRLTVLQQGPLQAGYHRLHWDGKDDKGLPLASGVYLYRLVTKDAVVTRRLTLLR